MWLSAVLGSAGASAGDRPRIATMVSTTQRPHCFIRIALFALSGKGAMRHALPGSRLPEQWLVGIGLQRGRRNTTWVGSRKERERQGDVVARVHARRPRPHAIDIDPITQTRNGIEQDARDGANRDVRDVVVRPPPVRPAAASGIAFGSNFGKQGPPWAKPVRTRS